ncbi:MAG TPA: SUMF1/EgtB/PvdO family nonheme iron enzyme [Candidatus Thiothrix moscowensis]|uniref:SUMF1/EgtB/PvdO family nonheme iron enzyme n=1 Tax=unclassified Thiothrix TaxID=2636184 RepID=UPI0025D25E7E|nr:MULTISPECIES: SUMF1/EgtB/PvdO family nonheme iron enzyme [unclassified Thiothrix]HRJ51729.1 SUMF1/EgtB/PvdO family nonheme iron enzyme [Candidatus Thiothrix moscowensis]HRJ92044.1 SUMF1/EgtB/PvdO family nonheme iron enzyme [Candidatus Thiothrix moscowensis]
MYDIFFSYSSKDRERLTPLVRAFERQGWSVFWDHQTIHTGENWHRKIEEAINNSRCVVVAWSRYSVQSEWVLEEAHKAKRRGVLLPVRIDDVEPPFGFSLRQAGDFTHWNDKPDHPVFIELAARIYALLADSSPPPEPQPATLLSRSRPGSGKTGQFLGIGVGVVAMAGAVFYMQQPEVPKPPVPAQTVTQPAATTPVVPVPSTPPTPPPVKPERQPFEPEMVNIPAGSFTMGCKEGRDDVEGGCDSDEKPAHKVTLSAFKLAKTEVTVGQFRAFVEATRYKTTAEEKGSCWSLDADGKWGDVKGNSWRKLGFPQTDDHPVACVSWDDAQAYVVWLGKETSKLYRLPTEAEWEYAARGGKENAYPWGQSIGKNNANCSGDLCGEKFDYTSPVGSFSPNPFGLYDMHGNAWEWVSDWKGEYAAEQQQDPKGASSGSSRVLRGGSWVNEPRYVRSALRNDRTPDLRHYNVGFRVAQGQ